ncbi:hypothetical protein GOP47_0018039 [Adiantum capillus-veneris]|uniref:Uncharacterized protein n=1 Tax=Adiantum capillus-veneris TaxID=13818 RepID=A0A9D4ZCE2_ADICA|nr:hypothetical protein GOP47_0018039 [Adiantum capillus-veneris]
MFSSASLAGKRNQDQQLKPNTSIGKVDQLSPYLSIQETVDEPVQQTSKKSILSPSLGEALLALPSPPAMLPSDAMIIEELQEIVDAATSRHNTQVLKPIHTRHSKSFNSSQVTTKSSTTFGRRTHRFAYGNSTHFKFEHCSISGPTILLKRN